MGRAPSRRDAALAALAFAIALGVYLRTLYPGLNGIGDTPKFQFVGKVLGTPHPPGYPVYTLLGWLFAQLPFGNLAWRINLLSALAASLAVALAFLLTRRLGARAPCALAAALCLATGPVFWSQATLAEVYALAAALLAALLLAVATWGATRETWRLELAVFLAALAMAHHTTVATVAPALVAYVLATDRTAALRPRFLLRGVLLVCLGLLPYAYVLVRNLQGAPYLGARARSLGELLRVMRGASFEGRLFAFDPGTVLGERTAVVFGILRDELTLGGVALALLGLVALGRRAPREGLLMGLAACGLLGFALNYDVPDLEVFLIPAFVVLWPLLGLGLDLAVGGLARVAAPPLVAACVLALPALQAALHFKRSDHSDRTFEMRYFGAVFEALPRRAAIAAESYTVDHMVLYELLGEGAARGRDVVTVPADAEAVGSVLARGYAVFAFEKTALALRSLGYRIAPEPVLDAPLAEYLRVLPGGRIAMQAGVRGGERLAAVGTGSRPEALVQRGDAAVVDVTKGGALADARAPVALRAENTPDGAALFVAGRRIVHSEEGVAFAVLTPGGRVLEAHSLDPGASLRVPFSARAFPLHRVVGPPRCVDAGEGGWVDVTAGATSGRTLLRIDNHAPFEARLVLWTFGGTVAPRLVRTSGEGTPEVEVRGFGARDPARTEALRADGLPFAAPRSATRLELRVNDGGQSSVSSFDLGDLPEAAWARAEVDLRNPRRAQVCALEPGDAAPLGREFRLAFDEDAEPFLGPGWHPAEGFGFRWSAAAAADVLVPVADPADVAIRVRAMPLRSGASLAVALGDVALEARPMSPGWNAYEWAAAGSLLRPGTNRLRIVAGHTAIPRALGLGSDERSLGVGVSDLLVRRR
ncbi:MAG TPA: DUF2723 domain-containing protein [Vicinamibacteria bacterium]|nr:DUF2723 domain-containing protein [Vicinamibacteria bacterium]